VGEIILRETPKNDEYASYFNQFNLKFAEEIKGFDPNNLFYHHMVAVEINTLIFEEEEGGSPDAPVHDVNKYFGDIETIVNTTKGHN
jgi:hypothetical protein